MEKDKIIAQIGSYNKQKFEKIKSNKFFDEEINIVNSMYMGVDYYKNIIDNIQLDSSNKQNSYILWLFDKVSDLDLNKPTSIVYSQKILPDYDTDFPASKRDDVINYIRSKYGHDRVAGVVTFSTLQGKNALKDVLRVYSACTFSEMNKITECIPSRDAISDKLADFKEETGSNSIIEYCLRKEPDLLRDWCYIEDNTYKGDLAQYFEIASKLEGAIKSESKHASAIIIGAEPIVGLAPLLRDKSSDELLVGLDMDSFEKVSLVKFDVLGIKSLDCLMEINNLIKELGIDIYEPAFAN